MLQLQLNFGTINFLPTVPSSISVFLPMLPDLTATGHTPSFFVLFLTEDPCLAKLAFCLICLAFNTWELPVPVPSGGDA